MILAAMVMEPSLLGPVLGRDGVAELQRHVELASTDAFGSIQDIPADTRPRIELLIAGWGVDLTPGDLDELPALRGAVHWAGGAHFMPPEGRARGLQVASNRRVNAVPVAEWTIAMIVLAAKDAFWAARAYRADPFTGANPMERVTRMPDIGLFRTTVGVVGASSVGRLVLQRLREFDVEVLLYDPFVTAEDAAELGAELVTDLVDLARRSRILSIQAPITAQTIGMISAEVLAAMPENATLLNTARGVLVDQDALVAELTTGRIRAILDVTDPEVLPAGHPLLTLDNVFVTPHLAGSLGVELRRLGQAAIAEVRNFVAGRPFTDPL